MRQGLLNHGLRVVPLFAAMLFAGCAKAPPPPPTLLFGGLPISGTLADAKAAGFTDCIYMDAVRLRCRKHGATIENQGPYEAAVDFGRGDGGGGFHLLTLWHDQDQYAVYKIRDTLTQQGWRHCLTGSDQRGDQAIFMRAGAPVWISMDLSYWGKRRLRIIPIANTHGRACTPKPA